MPYRLTDVIGGVVIFFKIAISRFSARKTHICWNWFGNEKYVLQSKEIDLDEVSNQVGKLMGIEKEAVWAAGKHRQTVRARTFYVFGRCGSLV